MEKATFYNRREDWPDTFQGFANAYIRARDTGEEKTNAGRRYDYAYFSEHLFSLGIYSLRDVTPAAISSFIRWRESIPEARSTVERRFLNIRTLFNFAKELGKIEINPALFVEIPAKPHRDPRWLEPAESEFLSHRIELKDYRTIRTEFTLYLFAVTGLRVGELIALNLSQLDLLSMKILDVVRKRHQYQSFPLPSSVREILILYLQARATEIERVFPEHRYLGSTEQGRFPLIISKYGADIEEPESFRANEKTVRENLKKRMPGLKPHRLRHTFARMLYNNTKDLVLTAKALGHARTSTTRRYAESSEDEVREKVEQLELFPAGRKPPGDSK